MVWGMVAVMAFNLTDTFFVAQLGTVELAALSFTFPVVMTLAALSNGLGMGLAAAVSRALGAGEEERARRLATHGLLLALVIVGALSGLGFLTIEPLFTALGAAPTTLPFIREYMEIWYAGMVFLVIPMVGNSAIRAAGNAKFPSLVMTVAAGINLILDPLLIFGLLGFPRLEMAGAALASLFARAGALSASLYILHRRMGLLTFDRPPLAELLASWKSVLQVGLPAAGTSVITPMALGLLTVLIAPFGQEAVAAYGAATRIELLSLTVFIALASVSVVFTGQNRGAKRYDRIREARRLSAAFALGWGVVLALGLGLFREPIALLFNPDLEGTAGAAALYLILVPVSYGAAGVTLASAATLNGLGRPYTATLLALGRVVLLILPLAWLGGRLWGVAGIFAAIAAANLMVGLASWILTGRAVARLENEP